MNEELRPESDPARRPRVVSRRTVAKGIAWTVPSIVVATALAPSAAAVSPSPPQCGSSGNNLQACVNFGVACGNTGAPQKGCGGDKTLQAALTLTNNTGNDVVFQITSMFTCNCTTAPTAAGAGVYAGVRGIWSTPNFSTQNNCTAPTASGCAGGATQTGGGAGSSSIVVPNGTTNGDYWIESAPTGNSSTFAATINWRILDKTTCAVLLTGQAQTASAIAPCNCGGNNC